MHNIKDKLKILLVTYNRKQFLQRTFGQILAENSPIRDFDITILDNASTDGSSELIEEYCGKFPNLTHIRNKINIGGNANICRAFEMGVSSGKEYVWVLCDDDKFDFSNWNDVENEIENKTDVICVSDYAYNSPKEKIKPESQIFQLTFVPAGIYRTELITDSILINMYDAILCMFPQACISLNVINNKKKIKVLSKPIVHNGIFFKDACKEVSFTRGCDDKVVLKRKQNTTWILGYVNVLTLLNDKKLLMECVEISLSGNNIYSKCFYFYQYMFELLITMKLNYFIEIYECLKLKRKFFVWFFTLYFLFYLGARLIARLYRNEKGIYINLFNGLAKIKLIPFKSRV